MFLPTLPTRAVFAASALVTIAPMLMLQTWKHSVGPCDQNQLDPLAFIGAFLDMALHGLLPATKAAPAA